MAQLGRPRAQPRRPARAIPGSTPRSCWGSVGPDIRVPFEVRELLRRILDGSEFEEFKPLYGSPLVCGWAGL